MQGTFKVEDVSECGQVKAQKLGVPLISTFSMLTKFLVCQPEIGIVILRSRDPLIFTSSTKKSTYNFDGWNNDAHGIEFA